MKFPHTPPNRQLMKMLASARKRACLTQQELEEKISERPNFVAKYQDGGKAPARRR